ncbi:MAG: pyrroline-5-carboxylate reductase family protein [Thermodesulfobacteriota bacterium]
MSRQNLVICFLGSGNMAEAIIKGLIATETVPASRIVVTDCLNARLEYLMETYGVKVRSRNAEAVRDSDVVFLTVKPHHVAGVLQEIAPTLGESDGPGDKGKKLLISIHFAAAGSLPLLYPS